MKYDGKTRRIQIAQETVEILKSGIYKNNKGKLVDISDILNYSITNSVLYNPNQNEKSKICANMRDYEYDKNAEIEITNETTLHGAKRLIEMGFNNVVCLNFASAKNPGGGFLNGSQAQEESLARASGLYPCISQMKEMYNYNRSLKTCLYSDYMIYSPKVPVFRDDNDVLLDEPFNVSFITSPAVNAGIVLEREPQNINAISTVMYNRIEKILSLGIVHKHDAIVLGAYGCGVFRNSPSDVASHFKKAILDNEIFIKGYKKILFAVFDRSEHKNTIKEFERVFSK